MIAAVLGFVAKQKRKAEESPGTMETGWRLTTARGNPRESATENKPPSVSPEGKGETVW